MRRSLIWALGLGLSVTWAPAQGGLGRAALLEVQKLLQEGKADEALKLVEEALKTTATAGELEDLLAKTLVARQRCAQKEAVELAKRLTTQDPAHAYGWWVMAECTSSPGPCFDKALAIRNFEEVLKLTRSDALPTAPDRDALLRLIQGPRADGLSDMDGLRTQILHWLADLSEGKKLLLTPDRALLEATVAKHQRTIADLEDKVGKATREEADAQVRLDEWKRRLEAESKTRRSGGDNLDVLRDNINVCARKVREARKLITDGDKQLLELREEVAPMQARMAQITRFVR